MSTRSLPASRRRARELALQVLYAIDLAAGRAASRDTETTAAPPDPSAVSDAVVAHFEVPPGAREFAAELVTGVRSHADELDSLIARHARNWRVERMAVVDRNILRLGTFEIAHTETPVAVVLNEAVDLARRFGGDPSPAFVNGVLDAVTRSLRADEERSA